MRELFAEFKQQFVQKFQEAYLERQANSRSPQKLLRDIDQGSRTYQSSSNKKSGSPSPDRIRYQYHRRDNNNSTPHENSMTGLGVRKRATSSFSPETAINSSSFNNLENEPLPIVTTTNQGWGVSVPYRRRQQNNFDLNVSKSRLVKMSSPPRSNYMFDNESTWIGNDFPSTE